MKKYRLIIFFILLLVVLNIGVVATSFLISKKINTFNAYSESLSQQQIALDKISKNIIDINLFAERYEKEKATDQQSFHDSIYAQLYDTKHDYQTLQSGVNLFHNGGRLYINNGLVNVVKPVGNAAEIDKHIQEIWEPLSGLVSSVINGFEQSGSVSNSTIKFTADYLRKYSGVLGGYLSALDNHYQMESHHYEHHLHRLHLATIIVTLLLLVAIIVKGLRSLVDADRKIERAQRETANIMKTVKEGLFLIDRNLHIASQYSAELEDILGTKKIAGVRLDQLLLSLVGTKDFETTEAFIEQLFNEDVIESLVMSLNPLDRVQVFLREDGNNTLEGSMERYLSFSFSRVYDGQGNIIRILGSVVDITKQVALEERLEKEKLHHDEQIELLSSILNIPTSSLQGFLRNVDIACNKINDTLKLSNMSQFDLRHKADEIFREVHGMKGEASALGLAHFVSIAESMENKVEDLRKRDKLSGSDFLPLTIDLEEIMTFLQKVKEVSSKVLNREDVVTSELTETTEANATTLINNDIQQLDKLVNEASRRNGKKVKLSIENWSLLRILSRTQQDKLREVVIQLLRNAVVHGIETPSVRHAHKKDEQGFIQCKADIEHGELMIAVRDDGQGINFEKLKEKAIASGSVPFDAELNKSLRQRLIQSIFESGISTADSKNQDAGRGVGMDVVKDRLMSLGAKIAIKTLPNESTTFMIRIPIL